jgi:hypothetical protein
LICETRCPVEKCEDIKGISGVDPGFQARGGAFKKIAPSGGRSEKFWVFRVKNHDFTQINHIFSNFSRRPPPLPGSAPGVNRTRKSKDRQYNIKHYTTIESSKRTFYCHLRSNYQEQYPINRNDDLIIKTFRHTLLSSEIQLSRGESHKPV